MIFVFTPRFTIMMKVKEVFEFENIDKAISFIDEHLKQNKTASFHNGPDDYIVVEGRKDKVKGNRIRKQRLLLDSNTKPLLWRGFSLPLYNLPNPCYY